MIKVTILLRRAPGASHEDFVDHHATVHTDLVRSVPGGREHIVRFARTELSARKASAVSQPGFDGIDELWIDDEQWLGALLASPAFAPEEDGGAWPAGLLAESVVLSGEPVDVIGDATTEASGVAPIPPAADGRGPLPRGINHIGLTVPELDSASDFLRRAFDARIAYDGLTPGEPPREGAETERQLGLPPGARIVRQRMVQIGLGPGIEMFEVRVDHQQQPARLTDVGLNHVSVYVDDIDSALARAVAAGGTALSGPHANSPHEDTEGNASVYVAAPWGTLFELQTIPGGHCYDEHSETHVWTPPARR